MVTTVPGIHPATESFIHPAIYGIVRGINCPLGGACLGFPLGGTFAETRSSGKHHTSLPTFGRKNKTREEAV